MDFESPDVEKDFPGLYASETIGKSQERDVHYSDEEKVSKKELLIGKLKDKKDKKDKGYVAFEGESSDGEMDESKGKGKKSKASFKFPGKEKKEKTLKSKDSKEGLKSKESKESKKDVDRESKDAKKKKESKVKLGRKKKKQEHEKDEKPLFGVPLLTALELNPSHDGIELPAIVRECIDYIEEHGEWVPSIGFLRVIADRKHYKEWVSLARYDMRGHLSDVWGQVQGAATKSVLQPSRARVLE